MGSSQSSVTVEREFVEEDRMRTKEMEKAMDKVPEAVRKLRPDPTGC